MMATTRPELSVSDLNQVVKERALYASNLIDQVRHHVEHADATVDENWEAIRILGNAVAEFEEYVCLGVGPSARKSADQTG